MGMTPSASRTPWTRRRSWSRCHRQYASTSPADRTARSLRAASAPSTLQRAPVTSMRSATKYRRGSLDHARGDRPTGSRPCFTRCLAQSSAFSRFGLPSPAVVASRRMPAATSSVPVFHPVSAAVSPRNKHQTAPHTALEHADEVHGDAHLALLDFGLVDASDLVALPSTRHTHRRSWPESRLSATSKTLLTTSAASSATLASPTWP